MLKTLSALHTPELLHVLASMGHGDEIALVDSNFPAVSHGHRVLRLDGADLPSVLRACLQLMPLDNFVKEPALRMRQVHAPEEIPEVQQVCQEIIDNAEGNHVAMMGIPREEFYERTRNAFAVIITGEQRPYGCVLLKKGVVFPGISLSPDAGQHQTSEDLVVAFPEPSSATAQFKKNSSTGGFDR